MNLLDRVIDGIRIRATMGFDHWGFQAEQHRATMIKRAMRVADLKRGDVVVLAYGPPAAGPSETSFLAVQTIR